MGSNKKPLPGERRAGVSEGVPGVPQGVPPDMVKGYQPPPEAPPPVIEAKQPKAKQKQPQKKTAAAPRTQPPQQQPDERADAAGAGRPHHARSRCSRARAASRPCRARSRPGRPTRSPRRGAKERCGESGAGFPSSVAIQDNRQIGYREPRAARG